MATEIEYKHLVNGKPWETENTSIAERIQQWFLKATGNCTVRVRIKMGRAFITIKSMETGASRSEFEYEIPIADALAMRELSESSIIEKVRYSITHESNTWEVDVFEGDNDGLVIAELEVPSENEGYTKPPWVGENVTDDSRYYNASLSQNPYSKW